MAVNKLGTEYIVEIQNGSKSEGILCCERLLVRVHDEGGSPFLSVKTENMEPDEEYDSHTVTLSRKDIAGLMDVLDGILSEHGA